MAGLLDTVIDWMTSAQRAQQMQGLGNNIKQGLLGIQNAANVTNQAARDTLRTGQLRPNTPAQTALDSNMVNAAMQLGPQAIVWHGSPHKFDKFDSSKIGTGEGAQAYGHGLYLAESKDVAQSYREALSKNVSVDGKKLQTVPSDGPMAEAHNMVVRNIQSGMKPDAAISAAHQYWVDAANEMRSFAKDNPQLADRINQEALSRMQIADAAKTLKPESFYLDPGSLYKVDLPDEAIAKMLDWDKPLSQQHPDVQKALSMIDSDTWHHSSNDYDAAELGKSIYQRLTNQARDAAITAGRNSQTTLGATQAKAAEDLRAFGIPGIRYLDGGSRGTGAGTSNFVVFPGNENLLTILERNGQNLGLGQ